MLEINQYKDTKTLSLKKIKSLVKSEIECWGSEPFDEYNICNNDNCKTLYSIEDIYGNFKNYRLLKGTITGEELEKKFNCNLCGDNTKNIYKADEYLDELINFFKKDVSLVLLEQGENVEGFGILNKGGIKEIFNEDMDKRPNSWNLKNIVKSISDISISGENIYDKEFIYSNKIYVSPIHRNNNVPFNVVKETFLINEKFKGIPIIGETRFDSNFYPFTKIMGYDDLLTDKYGFVFQYGKEYGDVIKKLNGITGFTDRKILGHLLQFKKYAKNILKCNPDYLEKKKYIL